MASSRTLLAVLLLAASVQAQLELAPAFGRHMVLQREAVVPVFGRTAPGAAVEVRATWPGSEVAHGVADGDGRFRVDLQTPAAGGPYAVLVSAGNVLQRLDDVLVGEVWVCSGQSNMEWPVRRAANADAVIAAADRPRIRLLQVPRRTSATPRSDFDAEWTPCTPETVADFSAVGYAFGLGLQRELDVPVGLIDSTWGGTPAESWTTAAGLAPLGDFAAPLAELARLAADPGVFEAENARARAAWQRRIDALDPGVPGIGHPVGWATPALDDASWDALKVPGRWAETALKDFDGIVWYRRAVDVPVGWAGRDLVLELGAIDDAERTYFAGTQVGATEGWNTSRRYVVPGRLVRGGPTVIAVRVHDTGGDGGFVTDDGEPRLFPEGREDDAIPLGGEWSVRRAVAQQELPPPPRDRGGVGPWTPSALYNGMIAPLVPFRIRGAIWYQGESNVGRAEQYERLFPAMITSWRKAWGEGDFPFYFVQIAPFVYANRAPQEPAELRDAQRKTLTAIPNVGMAVTMDVGDPRNIHPTDKTTVGERLLLWALAETYGRKGVVYSGPLFESVVREGDALRVRFAHAKGLATSDGAPPSHFEVAGADGEFVPAEARIDGETVVVRADGVAAPVEVRYAWGSADQPNLVNGAGLPASSFRGRTSP